MTENSKPIPLVDRMESACVRLMATPALLLVSFLVWEFGVLLLKAGRETFWYDELLTFHVSSLRPFSLVWRALQTGVDGMPPGYYLIVQLAKLLPGDPHVILRLPSILGYILTLLGTYWFVQKRLPAPAVLTALLLISLSPFRAYALEARSYALLVGFLAVSAALWQRIGESRLMTPSLAVFLTLAVSCHHYAVVAISCFAIAELFRTRLSCRIRWSVWVAFLAATGPFFMSLSILLNYGQNFGKTFWSRPSWLTVISTYRTYLGFDYKLAGYHTIRNIPYQIVLAIVLGVVIVAWLIRWYRTPGNKAPTPGLSVPEIALLGGFLFYPAFLVVLTKLLNSGYTPRYGWPAILGLVTGVAYLWGSVSKAYTPLLAALLLAFAGQAYQDFNTLSAAGSTTVEERWVRLEELSRDEPAIPVVIGSASVFLEAEKYSPPKLHDRLVQVFGGTLAVSLAGSDTTDKTNRLLARFVPLRVEDLAPFEAAHSRFILYSGGAYDWVTQYFFEKRYHMTRISRGDDNSVYIVER